MGSLQQEVIFNGTTNNGTTNNLHAYRLKKKLQGTLMMSDGEQTIRRHFFSSSFEELRRYSEREQ